MRLQFARRLHLILGCILLFAGVLVARLYFVQIVHGETFSQQAEHQYVLPDQNLYDRGSIFFTDKEGRLVSAATLRSGFTLAINPSLIEDPELVLRRVEEHVPVERETFLLRAGKKGDPYEEVAKRISPDEALAVEALKLPGVNVYKERWRYYPGNELAAQSVGFVAYRGDELAGRYGLERFYDDVLEREDSGTYVNFFAEIFSDIKTAVFEPEEASAGDVVTTIEPSVQAALERVLNEVRETWNSRQVGGIVIDPKTGAIYALGLHPSFDLNAFKEEADARIFSNPLVENVFEMGSIVKPLTVAVGLDTGAVTSATTYDDRGTIVVNGSRVSNFDGEARGVVSLQEILSQSLNVGAAFVEGRIGNERFAEYFRNFGLGEETGIDLPNETPGLITNLESPRDIEYVTASFGQGIAMSPMATTRALSALANGGYLPQPHLAREIRYESGLRDELEHPRGRQVISPESSEEITRMLVEVVDEALRGGTVTMEHYSIAAKTGTAQIADRESGGYYEDRYLHSFFGYFPAYDARFLVFLYNLEPQGARYASETLTAPFMELTRFLINYYDIPPDR